MASLLDYVNSDDAQLGLGLLAAAGPSATPMSLGQRLAQGVQFAQANKDNTLRRQLLQSQIDENASQAELRKAQIAKQAQIQSLTSGLLGDWSNSGGTSMGGGTVGGPTTGGAVGGITPAQAAGLRGVPIERIAALKAAGGPDLIEAWKAVNIPTSLPAGGYAFTPGQAPTYMADPSKGLGIGANGVFVLPGAATAQAQLARETERAKAEEQARFQEATPTFNPDGSKTVRSRLEQYGGGGGAPTLPGRPFGAAAPLPPPEPGVTGAFEGDPQKIAVAINAIRDPQERSNALAAFEQQMRATPGAANMVELPPRQQATIDANKAFQLNLAKTAADSVAASQAGAQSATSTLQNVQQIREGINKAILGPGANARVTMAQIGQVMGIGGRDSAEQLANTRAVIQGLARQELAAAGQMKGQGQITESEREILRKAEAGSISEFSKPDLEALLAALERTANYRLSSHERTMQNVNSGATPEALLEVKRPEAPAQNQPKLLQALPAANASNRGQRIRDTTTGKILISNGFQWKEQ